MSRLIDADLLMENLGFDDTEEEREENVGQIITWEDVDRMPTAFDVENVVSNLEQLKLGGACEDCGYCEYFNECLDGDMSEEHAIDMAIEIVKRGGRDERQ